MDTRISGTIKFLQLFLDILEKETCSMQAQDPQDIIVSYLLDSSKHEDNAAQPGSISILKEYREAQSIIYIVKYTDLDQQQIYARMTTRQTEASVWEFAGFSLMGGIPTINLPQKSPPQIAYALDLYPHSSFIGIVVLPNEVQTSAIRLKDSHGFVAVSQLENDTALFVTSQALPKPLYVEFLDDTNTFISQKRLG